MNTFGQRPEEQVVIDEVAFVRIKVSLEAALVFHLALEFIYYPIGEF